MIPLARNHYTSSLREVYNHVLNTVFGLLDGVSVVRILIVDDHNQFRAQLKSLLESVNEWQVCSEAKNGTDAVEEYCHLQPDVTVMDFNMPEPNGLLAS